MPKEIEIRPIPSKPGEKPLIMDPVTYPEPLQVPEIVPQPDKQEDEPVAVPS